MPDDLTLQPPKRDFEVVINELLVMIATAFILQMQLGFALIENGSVRSKNSKNILIKNMFDACAGALAFWLVGFGWAFGHDQDGGHFIGMDGAMFAAAEFDSQPKDTNMYALWIFQFSFAATSATIVSGSLAERTQLPAYLAFSTLMTGFIYPVIVGWCWGGGWLGDKSPQGKGFHDHAGSGVVHLVGGVAGFIGAFVVGPRHGKEKRKSQRKNVFDFKETQEWINMQNSPVEVEWWVNELQHDDLFEINSFSFIVFGTIMLIVSWLFFNAGSSQDMFGEGTNPPKIMMCTLLSAATGGISSAFLKPLVMGTYSQNQRYDVGALTNGMLAGAVSITAVCDRCQPWSAFLIGLISSLVYSLSCKLWNKLDVDDPIEASQVHAACGLWGLIAAGIFDNEKGLISDSEESGSYFGWQILGALAIIAWVSLLSLPYFLIMRKLNLLRVPLIHEIVGLEIAEMGSQAHVDSLVAMAIYRSHQRNMTAKSYRELSYKNEQNQDHRTMSPKRAAMGQQSAVSESLQSAVDIHRINLEIDREREHSSPH